MSRVKNLRTLNQKIKSTKRLAFLGEGDNTWLLLQLPILSHYSALRTSAAVIITGGDSQLGHKHTSSVHSRGEGPTQASLIRKYTGGCVSLGSTGGLRCRRTFRTQCSTPFRRARVRTICLFFSAASAVAPPWTPLPEIPGNPGASRDITKLTLLHRLRLFHGGLRPPSCRPTWPPPHEQPSDPPHWELKSKFHAVAERRSSLHS